MSGPHLPPASSCESRLITVRRLGFCGTSPDGRIQGQGLYLGNDLRNHRSGSGSVRERKGTKGCVLRSRFRCGPLGPAPLVPPGAVESCSLKGATHWSLCTSSCCHWLKAAPWGADSQELRAGPAFGPSVLLGLQKALGSVCSREMPGCHVERGPEGACYITVLQVSSLRSRGRRDLASVTQLFQGQGQDAGQFPQSPNQFSSPRCLTVRLPQDEQD